MNLYEMISKQSEKNKKKIALVFGKEKITYGELFAKINNHSNILKNIGIGKDEKVAILMKNCPEFIISYFATVGIGAVVVPLNFLLKEEELIYIFNDSRAVLLIASEEFRKIAEKIEPQANNLKRILYLPITDYRLLVTDESVSINPDDVASILYTSGTTGHPKGVMLTHKNFISNVTSCAEAIEISKKDRVLCFLPMFHSFAWTVCVLFPIFIGARIIILSQIKPIRKFLTTIFRKRITIFVGIPAIYNALIKMPKLLAKIVFFWVKFCVSGADALSQETLGKFQEKFKKPLLEGYGLTEASPVVSLNPLKGIRKPGTVGLPIPGVMVRVVDDKGLEVPKGVAGELIVRGGNVMKGYYELETATKEAIRDSWLYTGDIVKIDKDGYIKIVDRKKELIISKGLNIYPREIENILLSFPGIKDVAVIGFKTKGGDEYPKALIVADDNVHLDKSEIFDYCHKRLAPFKVPRKIEFREELPKTSLGKVEKKKLRPQNR